MSALPPKADIETQSRDVRFVPKADSCSAAKWSLFRLEPHYSASDCLAARIVVSVNLRPRPGRPACFVVRVRFCAIELLQASYFTLSHRIRRGSRLLKRLPGRPANLGRYAFRCRPGWQIPDPSFYSIQQSFGPAP